ncbi:MAG: DUF4097 family beta strand repeat-containing protein [Bacillota bacterium]
MRQFSFPVEMKGVVPEPLQIDLKTFNGTLQVVGNARSLGSARLNLVAQAASRAEAQAAMAACYRLSWQLPRITLRFERLAGLQSLSAELEVPASVQQIDLASQNGRVVVSGVAAASLQVTAENGSIEIRDASVGDLLLLSRNGRVSYTGSAVHGRVLAERGDISLELQAAEEPSRFSAWAKLGSVTLETDLVAPDLQIVQSLADLERPDDTVATPRLQVALRGRRVRIKA